MVPAPDTVAGNFVQVLLAYLSCTKESAGLKLLPWLAVSQPKLMARLVTPAVAGTTVYCLLISLVLSTTGKSTPVLTPTPIMSAVPVLLSFTGLYVLPAPI